MNLQPPDLAASPSLTLWLYFLFFWKPPSPPPIFIDLLNIPLTRNSPSGSAVEGGFFILKFQGFIMCHTYPLQLSPGKGQKYTAVTLFLRPELSLPLLWPLPSLHFLRQPKHLLSFTQTARTIRLKLSHAQNLGLFVLGYLLRHEYRRPAIDFLDMGQAWPHGPPNSLRPVIRSLSRCGNLYARDWRVSMHVNARGPTEMQLSTAFEILRIKEQKMDHLPLLRSPT